MLSGSLRRGPLTSGEGAAARTAGEVAELAGAYFERGVGGLRSTFDKAPSNLRGLWTGVVRGGSSPQEDDQPGARGPSSRSDAADATSQSLGLMMETADDDDDVEDQEGTEDDFRERVAWQSKYDAKTCFACGSAFNPITNRHHHCRACGRVVCGACSDHKDRVRGYSKPQRTCDECHESIQSEVSVNKLFMALCPCLKLFKKEIKRQRSAALLYEGAVFIKQRDLKSMSKNLVSGLFSKGSSGSSEDAGGDGPGSPSFSRQRVKVKLRNDGLALSVAPVAGGDDDDEEVYLHDVRAVEQRGRAGLALLGKDEGRPLFVGDLADKAVRDNWVKALDAAVKAAHAKPPPARAPTSGGRVLSTARRAKREIELQSKKRDAEKKKAEYMKKVGGGLKYTALAMADRSASAGVA